MKNTLVSIGIVLLVLCLAGCGQSDGQTGKAFLSNDKYKDDRKPEVNVSHIDFYAPDNAPDISDPIALKNWSNLLANNMASLVSPLLYYHRMNDKWPEDWASLLNGHIALLPANPDTHEPYDLIALDDLIEPVAAGTIIADISGDGWELYCAKPRPDGSFDTECMSRERINSLWDTMEPEFDDSEFATFRRIVGSWATGAMQTFANRHARLPETYEELTEGYVVNPAFASGYAIGDNGSGSYKFGVKLEEHWYAEAFVDENGWEHFQIVPHEVDEYGRRIGPDKVIAPVATEENRQGFIWLLTQEDFMD
jgi:hypothetical protein